ncbi:hypothetical protein D3C78_1851320 [compost metagenome]
MLSRQIDRINADMHQQLDVVVTFDTDRMHGWQERHYFPRQRRAQHAFLRPYCDTLTQ